MTIPRKYEPIGRCIYCGAKRYTSNDPLAKLGDEHIIPLAFGGNLLLPEASCRACEKITSRIGTHCIEQMVRTRGSIWALPRGGTGERAATCRSPSTTEPTRKCDESRRRSIPPRCLCSRSIRPQ